MPADESPGQEADDPSWLDAFPWLEADRYSAATSGVDVGWKRRSILGTDRVERQKITLYLVATVLQHLVRWTVGAIFPTLPADLLLTSLPLTNRALNALVREGLTTFGDIQDMEVQALLGMKNVGIGTVESILRVLTEEALTSPMSPPMTSPGLSTSAPSTGTASGFAVGASMRGASDDLMQIGRWLAAIGTVDAPLLAPPGTLGVPPAVLDARQRLSHLTARSILGDTSTAWDPAAVLDRSIAALDERELCIVRDRLFADRVVTLEQLGVQLGLTRERVRQIESRARGRLVQFLSTEVVLDLVAQSARLLIDAVLPLEDLLLRMPALGTTLASVDQPLWRVLDRLDDSYEIVDGWCAAPSLASARAATVTRLQELANPYGVVSIDEFGSLNPCLEPEPGRSAARRWLHESGFALHGDFVLTSTQSLADRAAALLSITGSPLAAEQLLEQLGLDRSLGSLKNAMSVDERIERVDRDRWALAEWGMDAYSGLRALVGEELDRNGGRISMDRLIEKITSRYSVRPNSVMAYASAPPFESVGGIVRRRSSPQGHRKTPQETRRLYRRDDEWLYRVQVNQEHLRGSGTLAPMAIAGILDLNFGDTCVLDSPPEPQTISWTAIQPSFGSIRRLLIKKDIAAGTEVFLVITDSRSFRVDLVAPATGNPEDDALSLVGAGPSANDEDARAQLAAAIGLPAFTSVADLVGSYRSRGDSDVADLIVACRHRLGDAPKPTATASPDIDEILELL